MDEHLHNHIDNLYRDSLQFHNDAPSEDLWEKIEKQLDKDDRLLFNTNKRMRLWISAGLLAFLSGAGLFTLRHFKTEKFAEVPSNQNNKDRSALTGKNPEENGHLPGSQFTLNNGQTANNSRVAKTGLAFSQVKKKIRFGYNKLNLNNGINDINLISKSPGDTSDEYFRNSVHTAIDDLNLPDLHLSSVQSPASEKIPFNFVKEKFPSDRKIPDDMIVKHENRSFNNRFSITPYFSQEFAGYNLSDNDATAADGREIEKRERNVFSASVGLYLNYRFNKRWVIQSGISYSWSSSIIDSSKSYAVKNNSGIVQFRMNTISGYGYLQTPSSVPPSVGDSVLTAKAYSQLHYLTVPVVLSYRVPMNRFSLLAGAGITFNFLTGATVETKIYGPNFRQDESAVEIKGLKKVNYGILLKAELEYHINSRFGIDLIPTFKNALSPINIHSALSAYPYNFGVGLGVNYRL